MSAIGPTLPPHLLAKRKRQQEEQTGDETVTASGANRSPSPGDGEKRRRVVGPAMPPAPISERPDVPTQSAEDSDSDDDDGFGPSLPPNGSLHGVDGNETALNEPATTVVEPAEAEEKLQRDEWMTMPPKQDDLAARMDPSKQRARGFNTGKGAKGASLAADDSSTWHETPEQKQKRLADEMMGVTKVSNTGPQGPPVKSAHAARDEASGRKIREHTVRIPERVLYAP